MSRIYFHSPSGDAQVRGPERAHAGVICDRIGVAMLDLTWHDTREKFLAAVTPDPSPEDAEAWYALEAGERWAQCMRHLRADRGGLELRPEDFDSFVFGAGVSALDVYARLQKQEAARGV